MEIQMSLKIPSNFCCDKCHYNTANLKDFKKHTLTKKHISMSTEINGNIKEIKKIPNCSYCGKHFQTNSGLWKHKKKCSIQTKQHNVKQTDNEDTYQGINIKDKDALVLHLLKQNGELQNKIIEMASHLNITNNNSHNTNTTHIDNNFNLNFFLNETCKNAMNITDFVSSIQMNFDDLEHTGRSGYIEGISNIIVKNLNKLENHMRPLHCSDLKREVLYIKDNNEWTKETYDKPILTNAIKTIANKNIKQINKWKDNYPDCAKSNSNKNDLYLKIVSNSMNGLTKEEGDKNINKIISNISKNVIIEK